MAEWRAPSCADRSSGWIEVDAVKRGRRHFSLTVLNFGNRFLTLPTWNLGATSVGNEAGHE